MNRFRRTERSIPAYLDESIQHPDGMPAVVHLSREKLHAMGFAGKALKSAFYHTFRSPEQMETHIKNFFDSVSSRAKAKAERAEELRKPHDIKPGAIVYNSWGYDQTNLDFYEVTSATPHFVTLREIASVQTDSGNAGSMSGYFKACPGQYITDKETRHKVSMGGRGPSIKFRNGAGSVWDGQPKFSSWYA